MPVLHELFFEESNTNEQRSQSDLCERVIRREATETEGLVLLKLDCCMYVYLFVCLDCMKVMGE